ncbi:MAG: hypothetical protein K6G65_07950 [Lachnospiraceae bacterium]|nr:hypothetical protein [Lachnospiraceae bacterium]
MKKMIGFILFWIAVGMTIMLFYSNGLLAILSILLLYILSIRLFLDC